MIKIRMCYFLTINFWLLIILSQMRKKNFFLMF